MCILDKLTVRVNEWYLEQIDIIVRESKCFKTYSDDDGIKAAFVIVVSCINDLTNLTMNL